MINKIIDGISVAISSKFGDLYEIYTESIEQGLNEPCFSIVCINHKIEQVVGKRYFRMNEFCIHYFPSSEEKGCECNDVAETLMDILEMITVDGDMCRGTDMEYYIEDNVLSFMVNYDMYVRRETEPMTEMEHLSQNTNLKG